MRGSRLRRLLLAVVLAAAATGYAVAASAGPAAADYTGTNLPDWAIGPFSRYNANPILTAQGSGFEANETYNPGVVVRGGVYRMLYRGQRGDTSQIGYATSTDGHTYTRYAGNPVITNSLPNATAAVEDPRLYELNGTYYTFFTGVHNGGYDINEATSTDMVHWTQLGPIVTNNKNAAVVTDPSDHPLLINGRYVMYYGGRASGGCAGAGCGTGVAYSTDMVHWTNFTPIDLHLPSSYAPVEICVAVTDYQTVQGGPVNHNIVLFIAGGLMSHGRWFYAVSEMVMSRADPTRSTGQLTDAVLSPAAPYEQNGLTPNTIFMNTIMFNNGQWWMNYGGGDTVVGLATAPLRGSSAAQFSSTSLESGQRLPDWADVVDTDGGTSAGGIANVNPIPGYGLSGPEASMRAEIAHSGTTALMYSGSAAGAPTDYAYLKLFDLSTPLTIGPNTVLSYWIYPQGTAQSPLVSGDNSSCVAIDADLTDGTALRNTAVTDQGGGRLHPEYQCGRLALGQWNHVTARLGALSGKQISRIDIGFDRPGGGGGYRGYVDDISITG
ncbi:hypothetical protein AB0M46_27090 [Dactylosporangium sp. NPDC051485]|uniref:glycoside hydrolase family 130 protein n=1 Tax=Dactylosporangium sp. NPDC051485 TaxID=3154846 RepID=UPI00341940DC